MQVVDAVVVVQTVSIDDAFTECRHKAQLRTDRHHHRHQVRRLHSPAFGTAGSNPAYVTIFLQTEVNAFAPLVILIVIIATCVEQEVAADGAHVAEDRRRDCVRGFCNDGIVAVDDWMFADVGQGHGSADS